MSLEDKLASKYMSKNASDLSWAIEHLDEVSESLNQQQSTLKDVVDLFEVGSQPRLMDSHKEVSQAVRAIRTMSADLDKSIKTLQSHVRSLSRIR